MNSNLQIAAPEFAITGPRDTVDASLIPGRIEWVKRATKKLLPYLNGQSANYAESLYQSYQAEDHDWMPEDAVFDDMSYWD